MTTFDDLTTTITTVSGRTRVIPPNLIDVVVGLDPDGRIVVDHFDALDNPTDGAFVFGLTLCHNASDKGTESGVVCRACYSDAETGNYLFAVLTGAGEWTYPELDPVSDEPRPVRFEVRKDAVHKFWGVWDNKASTWHEAGLVAYADAYSAAGIPMWDSETRAREIAADLNASKDS